ncbi:unnamed protein product [Psylliodes chrysocephalus]|uniref:Insulin-like domain-containing protein n=1 Tax=Psylliodes chrysocephalus TaxID=3402493 RepID=A0A9P0C7V5_9CUCU|nr:unnamed protein product [Psylliodes chrysocephala]
MEFRFRLLLITFLIGPIHCQYGDMQGNRQPGPKKYCGSQIGQALSAVCQGNYNTLKRVDRYPRPTQWDAMYGDAPAPDMSDFGFPYQTRSEATSLMGGKRRKKRWGVYNECCEKSCTREELSSYCAAPSKRRRR